MMIDTFKTYRSTQKYMNDLKSRQLLYYSITLTISKHTIILVHMYYHVGIHYPYLPCEYIMYWNNLSVSKATGKKTCIFAKAHSHYVAVFQQFSESNSPLPNCLCVCRSLLQKRVENWDRQKFPQLTLMRLGLLWSFQAICRIQ